MFLKCCPGHKGKIYLSFVQGYRDEFGKSKQRTIEKIGYLEDLKKLYDDPISHFKEIAKQKNSEEITELTIKNINSKTVDNSNTIYNLGYSILKKFYNDLNLKDLFSSKQSNLNIEYKLNDIFQLLVYSRILYPGSKKETFENKNIFFDNFDFSLKDLYRSLDNFASLKDDILKCIWNNTKNLYNRDTSTVYYDCTNYYFEISYNDEDLIDEEGNVLQKGYRKKGPSKENRKDPIIQMGLLMDNNGIPLSYNLFPGNESEKTSLRPELKRTKSNYNLDRIITVADRGLNTSDNTIFISGKNDSTTNKDGYVFGQSVLASDEEFKNFVLKQDDYIVDKFKDEFGNDITFKHKSRIFAKTVTIKRTGKRTNKATVYQKQMVYYSEKYALRQKKQRDLIIQKAKDLINNPGKYTHATSYGAAAYINNIKFDKDTGIVSNGLDLSLKLDRIKQEEQFDGYYSIVTSELEMPDKQLRDVYKGLWKIEESFKITKSTLEARPVYVWTKEHIEAHFLTCFVSLVIMRLLEQKTDRQYPIEQVIKSLKMLQCNKIEHDIYLVNYTNDIIKLLEQKFNINLSDKYPTLSKIKKILN